jgi:voltage-gated potassium channel Kch
MTFRRKLRRSEWEDYFGDEFDIYKGHFDGSVSPNSTLPPLPKKVSTKMDFLYYIEYITVVYFTIEIIVRIVLYPFHYKQFIRDFLNIVDIFSLLVMYSIYFVTIANPKEKYERSLFDIIHCLQIIRIFRLFRLVKNADIFRILLYAIKASAFEVLLVLTFLMAGVLVFGVIAFYAGDVTYSSIPEQCWWAVITMTTVGYGDIMPTTGFTRLIGALCAVTGVCLLAIIISIFVKNIFVFYDYSKIWRTSS